MQNALKSLEEQIIYLIDRDLTILYRFEVIFSASNVYKRRDVLIIILVKTQLT